MEYGLLLLVHEVVRLTHQYRECQSRHGQKVLNELGGVDGEDGEGGWIGYEVGEKEGEGGEEQGGREGGEEGREEDSTKGFQLDLLLGLR